jgi:hypothetical protein
MKWILAVLLSVHGSAVADVYVAIPADTSKALYFPNVDTVTCVSTVQNGEPVAVETDRCWPVWLPTIIVQGKLLLLARPIDQLLQICASLDCELRDMPDE